MNKYRSFLLFFFFVVLEVHAQKPAIKIRQSFQSAGTKAEPAVITYTTPKEGSASFLIDAAVGVSLPANAQRTFSGFIEHHRNSLVDQESNSWLDGIAYEFFTKRQFASDKAGW